MLPDVGVSRPASMPQQRRLATTGTAENREQFALADFKVDVVDGDEVTEMFAEVFDVNKVFHRPLFMRARVRVRARSFTGSAASIEYIRFQTASSG